MLVALVGYLAIPDPGRKLLVALEAAERAGGKAHPLRRSCKPRLKLLAALVNRSTPTRPLASGNTTVPNKQSR